MKLYSNETHGVTKKGNSYEFKVNEPLEVIPDEIAELLIKSYPKKYSKDPFDKVIEEPVEEVIEETVDDGPVFSVEDLDQMAEKDLHEMFAEKYGKKPPYNIKKENLLIKLME